MQNGFLYNSGKIQVSYFRDSVEDHILTIAGYGILLQRGVLEELSRSPLSSLRSKLSAIDPLFPELLEKNFLDVTRIGSALVSARFKEQQLERDEFHDRTKARLSR